MKRLDEIREQLNKPVSEAVFGDVLRIIWTTYYFGADSQWHNARTGDVETAETLAEEQEAAKGDWEWVLRFTPALTAAVQGVLDVHQPVDAAMYAGIKPLKVQVCTGCGQDDGNWQRYPCPTVRAITAALDTPVIPRRDTIRECFGITVAQVIAALVITVAFIAPDAIVSLLWGL